MPDLKIKGSINDNFGKYLPTPVIDYVGIRDDKIEVQISLFFNFSDLEENPDEVLNYFGNPAQAPLYVTTAYVLGNSYAQDLITKTQTDIFKELYNRNNASYKFKGETTNIFDGNSNYNSRLCSFDTQEQWTQSDQNFYTENEEKLVQFSTSVDLPININNKNLSLVNIDDNILLAPNGSLSDEFEGAVTVFAFCSWFNPEGDNPYTNTTTFDASSLSEQRPFPVKLTTIEDDNRILNTFYADLMPNVAKQQVSNIAYQQVFKNGAANVDPEVLFIDQEGVFYNQTPILSIEGKYHKQSAITLEQITNIFQEFVNQINELPDRSSELQAVADDIGTILAVDGESSDLVIKLNLVRTTFPEKSTATQLGRFYEKFKNRFFGVHEAISRAPTVTEKLVRTSKVRDLRESSAFEYEAPTTGQPMVIYGRNNGTKEALVTSLKIWREGADESSDESVSVKNGFWFFDYQLALENYADVGQVFNITSLQRRFGAGYGHVITQNFKVEEARVRKFVYQEEIPDQMGLYALSDYLQQNPDATSIPETYLEDVTTITSKIEYKQPGGSADAQSYGPRTATSTLLRVGSLGLTSEASSISGKWIPAEEGSNNPGTHYITQLSLRGVDALNDEELNNSHALMTFQFQDVEEKYDSIWDNNEVYQFEVDCVDSSKGLIQALTASFVETFNNTLTEYYDLASEYCSYNNIDGVFNNFFTEGIMGYYANTEPQYYPWVYAPAMYNFHRDMLTDAFAGDDQKLIDDCRAITSRINPTNGNLEDLDTFYENYKKIVELYESGGAIYELVNSMPETVTKTFGDGSQFAQDLAQYFPMPTPVPITTEVYEEEEEEEEEWTADEQPIEEPEEIFTFKKVRYQKSFEFDKSGDAFVGTREEFKEYMKDIFFDWFDWVQDPDVWHISPEQLYDMLDTSPKWGHDSNTGYYHNAKDVIDDIPRRRQEVVYESAIIAMKKWVKYAWFNSASTANNRPGHGWNWREVAAAEWGINVNYNAETADGGSVVVEVG